MEVKGQKEELEKGISIFLSLGIDSSKGQEKGACDRQLMYLNNIFGD